MRKIFLVLSIAALTACSSLTYKLEVQQGNYVTEDMIAKLKVGMTRSQVRFLLGTPLLVDPFHANRWDYIYRVYYDGKVIEDKQFVVFFDGDAATRFEGSVMPPLKGFVAAEPKLSPRAQTLEKAHDIEIDKIKKDAKQDGATPKKE